MLHLRQSSSGSKGALMIGVWASGSSCWNEVNGSMPYAARNYGSERQSASLRVQGSRVEMSSLRWSMPVHKGGPKLVRDVRVKLNSWVCFRRKIDSTKTNKIDFSCRYHFQARSFSIWRVLAWSSYRSPSPSPLIIFPTACQANVMTASNTSQSSASKGGRSSKTWSSFLVQSWFPWSQRLRSRGISCGIICVVSASNPLPSSGSVVVLI